MIQQSHSWSYTQTKLYFEKIHAPLCSWLHNSQGMETALMSIDRWMDKDVVHIYNGLLLSHKKNEFESVPVR